PALAALAGVGISTGLGLLLAVMSSAAPPSLSVTANDAVIGQTIRATAQLSESPSASGEISFEVFGPGDPSCSGPALPPAPASASVSGEGEYASGEFTPPEAGVYHWSAHYSGDLENPAADSACAAASTVSRASPGMAGTASGGKVNTAIHDQATVTGGFSPTGEVIFRIFGPADTACLTPLATDAVPLQDGSASSADFLPQQAGEFRWTATYEGDENNEPAGLPCGSANQASAVGKASPSLVGVATSAVVVGSPITDGVTLTGGFEASGQLVFRAYGPGDQTCATTPKYEAAVAVAGNGSYSPSGFSPAAGLYRWTVGYPGDANNQPASLPCGSANQASAVGTITATLAANATSATVGKPVTAMASIQKGAIPTGQIRFTAFPPGDANCSGSAAFSSTVKVSGNGSYRSAAFVPSRVGTFRWTVSYSGDPNHAPTSAGCGKATSSVSPASPSISSNVTQRLAVGASFRVTATLQGGYAPGGTITLEIYRRVAAGCARPVAVGVVPVAGNGTFRSEPLVAQQPGAYSFGASYSGDATNRGATDSCNPSDPAVRVYRRTPQVKPRARLNEGNQISIRARLSGAASPFGTISFRLYRPGDKRCKRKPAFSGGVTVRSNGNYLLAQYLATKPGVYRLSVGYSGDQRNRQYKPTCRDAQQIRIG
ncbi:MAG TPA: Ig-like domain-containing protein, partial [Solirubrobacterales bacterium]|nr:Ig-like domain-containing protein [Solirubrobacterales bacterium]